MSSELHYIEKLPVRARRLLARERQAAWKARHPDYWREWAERVGYPSTVAGQRKWREERKEGRERRRMQRIRRMEEG